MITTTMAFENVLEILCDMFKNSFPYSFLYFVPLLFLISPVSAAQDFPVYRVQHFDMAGNSYGSRNTMVNMEAKLMDTSSAIISRRCIIAKLQDLSLASYRDLSSRTAGAILIILPRSLADLTLELKQQFLSIEKAMVSEDTLIPIYFTVESEQVNSIYQHILQSTTEDAAPTATAALLNAASANGFQMTVNVNAAQQLNNFKAVNIHGVLEGNGNVERLPTIVFVAHYDTFGVAPGLAFGADSNGSGVAALLELMRIFSRMYSSASSHPRYNIVFLLSGAGKFNYFGTKKWLENMKDSDSFPYLSDVSLVLCLDTIARDGPLYMHVSKPPKDGSSGQQIYYNLVAVAQAAGIQVETIHKKIFLGEAQLAWEHEQFSMHRLSGCTISSLFSHKAPDRNSALDVRSAVNSTSLARNTQLVGEAIARFMFDMSVNETDSVQVLQNDLAVNVGMIDAWLDVLTSESRAAQLMNANHPTLIGLEQAANRYLKSVARTTYTMDKKDPEFTLYGNTVETMSTYNVKPAVFDLILALCIAAYLGLFFTASLIFYPAANFIISLSRNKSKQA